MDEEPRTQPDVVEARGLPSWRRWAVPAGLLGSGALIGGVLAATLTAGAAPSPSPSPVRPGAPGYGYGAPGPGGHDRPGGPGGFHGLDQTGTVTAVGTNSVTIKTSKATTTYAVAGNSDIDKNGEAKLSNLKVGDAVRFSAVTVSGKPTIGILHAGNEALNRPKHGPGDADGDHHFGPRPNPSGSSTSGASQTNA